MKKLAIGLAISLGGAAASAQIPPHPPTPMGPPPRITQATDELAQLISAQTEAIKALSAKLDAMDERIAKLEANKKK